MASEDRYVEVSASELRDSWHAYLDQVAQGRKEIIVTRHGRPIARLSPVETAGENRESFGWMAGTVTIHEDIISPLEEKWEAES
jgi:prevent-host-death family protein